ncbi:hypothetical protein BK049_11880 [Bacillus xiamenensis]|uniref:Uncharacterized protein n=1 Tax=Bacillus xiamenensis TaxID=1178537 RepID=A0AAC9IJ77_9BACI|nr:hypothetical protein [Bacillus xiamenensis]AOZ89324.1 hypothetical protein BK049_11880 [Bacillus xiamenensis]
MNLASIVKQEILSELKKGNTEVLKGLPPVLTMQYGLALQNEASNYTEKSPINDKAVGEAMLSRMADSGVKERLIKEIEAKEKERAEKVEQAKQITKEVTGE